MTFAPPQSPPVFRDPLLDPDRAPDADTAESQAAIAAGGVQASQTMCDGLRGPARSMCYASLYGVSI
jgi:hypothetical protein